MMKRLLLTVFALAWLCPAEDFVLADGERLQEVRVLRRDDESVTMMHSSGVVRVPFDRLTPELQKRFQLTPAEVESRRDKLRRAEQERALAREKKMAEQRAALAASNLSPRYVTGVELASMYGVWGAISNAGAEYLAAEWNRREALRCGLTVEASRYKEDAAKWLPQVQQEQAEARKASEEQAALAVRLKQTQEQLEQARRTVKKLETQLAEQSSQKSNTTIITTQPTVVPVYRPAPVVLPPVVRPLPPPGRPAPPVRPYSPISPPVPIRR